MRIYNTFQYTCTHNIYPIRCSIIHVELIHILSVNRLEYDNDGIRARYTVFICYNGMCILQHTFYWLEFGNGPFLFPLVNGPVPGILEKHIITNI